MKKLLAIAAACFSLASFAQTAESEPVELEQEQPVWLEGGFEVDLFSAYVYRSTVFNDEMVIQPCVWLDFVRFSDYVTLGGYVWQNWNLTSKQRDDGVPNEMNETDFNLHLASTVWSSDDEEYSLNVEFGNEWFVYRYDLDTEYELYLRLEFDNPFVNLYGRYSHALTPENGVCFELGLNREWNIGELCDSEDDVLNRFTVGLDWSILLGSGKYFSNYAYGMLPQNYDSIAGEYLDERYMHDGVGGTTIKGFLNYEVCDNFSIGLVLAFTSTLSRDAREYMDSIGSEIPSTYKDLVWGGLHASLSF